jgi:hypothetical protein
MLRLQIETPRDLMAPPNQRSFNEIVTCDGTCEGRTPGYESVRVKKVTCRQVISVKKQLLPEIQTVRNPADKQSGRSDEHRIYRDRRSLHQHRMVPLYLNKYKSGV